MEDQVPCQIALDYLVDSEVKPVSECVPAGSAAFYIPARNIRALFTENPHGLTLEKLFLCPCGRCVEDGEPVDQRLTSYNRLREQELRGEYALIYALLIYIRRPGLIRKFQKHELKLQDSTYLREGDFEKLHREHVLKLPQVQKKVLDEQYKFLVRTLRPFSDVTAISSKEVLPINEDPEPKGKGTFAEVWCFEFQDDEFRSREFGEHVTRFARKIFHRGMKRPAAKEWNNLQQLSKEENHPHLMVALGAYWHGNIFFILQEEAEQSLLDYLKGEGDEFESEELWKQMKGVADGLAALHKLYKGTRIAYHQDLKPANILVVKRKLKIADFGLLAFKTMPKPGEDGTTGVPKAHNADYYAAPRRGTYTRDSDIWSLGCIMSELATCDLQGRDEFRKYKDERAVGDTPRFFSGQAVKTSVLQKHDLLYVLAQIDGDPIGHTQPTHFQNRFYIKDFFFLLNSMFGHKQSFGDGLQVSSEVVVPDAGCVAETIDRLRKKAMPEIALGNGSETLNPKQQFLENDVLDLPFEQHFKDFIEVLIEKNKLGFPCTTLAHLKQYIVNLQAKQHRERRHQGFPRLGIFLERFEQLGDTIKQSSDAVKFMGCIWGPVKFLLEATEDHPDASTEIIAIYQQIGRNQPSASMYQELTITQLSLTDILSETYKDVMEVNKWLVLYFQQRLWTKLYATTWNRHKPKFSSVIARMVSRYNLVRDRASISQFDTFLSVSAFQEGQHLSTTESEDLSRKQAVNAWLKPTDLEFEQEFLVEMRAKYPDTCRWLLRDDTFAEWFDPQCATTTSPKLLWLNGKPGAGKTVLASLVVQEARALKQAPTVLFFYFKHEDSERNNFLSMARTLLMQIIAQTPLAFDYFYSKCCNSGGALLNSRTVIEELLEFALENCTSAYIILDGIDECQSRKEKCDIVKWFRDLIENQSADSRDRLRCLFVSQVDSARKDYKHLPSITADLDNNEEDIESFSKMRSAELVEKLKISVHEANDIAASVSASAEGNFLFAHLMWINLCGQSSIDSLDQEIKSFPADLDKLDAIYARIMNTILKKHVRAEREEALMILRWLVCAKRSLKMHEIQTMKSINLERRVVDFDRRHFRVDPKDLCESLVNVRDDGTVELVHMTARFFLAKSEFLDAVAEELRLATLCIDYLNLPSFEGPYTERAVFAGEYGFMEYAILYWVRHLEAGLKSFNLEHDEIYEHLTESFEILIQQHWNNPSGDSRSISHRTRDMLEIFSNSESFLQIQLAFTLTDKELKNFGDLRPDQSALDFARISSAVRHCIETVAQNTHDQRTRDDLERKYGAHLFKCSRFSCRYFNEGFLHADERDKHTERHERPFRCTDEHCRGSRIGFATQAHLEKHCRENHPDTTERSHNFPTEEEIHESMNDDFPEPEQGSDPEPGVDEEENDSEPQPDVVVSEQSAAPAPSAVNPLARNEVSQSTEPREAVKRQKTKQDYECSYCNKKYKKKFNWQSHLKSHGEGQQLQCPHCETKCKRSGDLARHMRLHDPEFAFTCGGILSNGQRWGCGQTFARADILRSHHQSRRGRQCTAQRDGDE